MAHHQGLQGLGHSRPPKLIQGNDVDQKFRDSQRAYNSNPEDSANSASYIANLERMLGIKDSITTKVQNTDKQFPCLLCERLLSKEWEDPLTEEYAAVQAPNVWLSPDSERSRYLANPWQGITVESMGNYGSQVLDGEQIHFLICDACVIKNSHKMLFQDGWSRQNVAEASPLTREILNARDHYETWFKKLESQPNRPNPDTYLETIRPYFK